MKKISITISGHRTSITLESEFLDALKIIAKKHGKPLAKLIHEIDEARPQNKNLSSAIRVFVLLDAQNKPTHL